MPQVVQVLFPLPLPAFSYLVPFEQRAALVGCRVVVPWQSGVRIGLVTELSEVPALKASELREYICALEEAPFIPAAQTRFLNRLAEAVCAPPGQVLAALAATGFGDDLIHEVRRVEGAEAPLPETWTDVAEIELPKLDTFRRQGLVRERVRVRPRLVQRLVPLRTPDEKLAGKPQAAQKKALKALHAWSSSASGAELARETEVSESAVRALVKKGYAGYEPRPAPPPALPSYPPTDLPSFRVAPPADLRAVSGGSRAIRLATLLPMLKKTLKAGKSALIVVPEQALLAETASYLASALPTQTVSGELNDAQRERLWDELAVQAPVVLVCSYLGLLAPLPEPGQVVVLEEGSSSYKLQSGPRLFVPVAARLLAECWGVPYTVTDALLTPETVWRVPKPNRSSLPPVQTRLHVTDLTTGTNWPLSGDLVRVLKQVAERERQAVVLAPRRGFSAALGCANCGWLTMCPNCDLFLRYHQRRRLLQCHQCGHRAGVPNFCGSCTSPDLGPLRGAGTQWIMNEVKTHLGEFPLYQYDADTRDDLRPLLEGEPGVVVATTAVLRHDQLPNISLIALTLFDTLLGFSDFRAEEETLRLLLSLSELAPGRRPLTLIQTFQPEHALLKTLLQPDLEAALESFMAKLMARREHFKYPPFVEVAKIQVSARRESDALSEAERLAGALELHAKENADILGPNPAPVTRLRGLYNYQIFVRDLGGAGFRRVLEPALSFRGRAKVRIDVDPRDIGGFLS